GLVDLHLPSDAVRCGILARRAERLGVDIEAVDLARPELGGRQRQYSRAAAIVDDARTHREVRIEPREAQRGARMSAGAECESRIERHDDGTGSADALVTRTYPERSEEHTSELQSRRDLVCRLLLEKKNINK